jgi:transcription elongation factor Elf1
MVHYDPDRRHAAQTPPPTCPKCGSHRTEVVDRAEDGRTVTVRCNSCGERSTVLIDRRASDADNVTDEVEAIRAVGRALAQLPDAASRVRVLRWASERFQIDITLADARAAAPSSPAAAFQRADVQDPTLSVEGVHEMFPAEAHDRGDMEPMMAAADTMIADQSPLFVESRPVVVETPRAEETPRLDSMLGTFVSDFRRLAIDLDTVFAVPAAGSR